MKNKLLLLVAICAITVKSFATTYTINVQDFSFSPSSLTNVHIGDMIMWQWINGSHTTTSLTIPTGAASWDQPITSSSQTYTYAPTVVGTYNYQCTPHAPSMAGSFTVVSTTGVGDVNGANSMFLYPNPAVNMVHLNLENLKGAVDVTVYDVAGRVVLQSKAEGGKKIDLSVAGIANGAYTVSASGKGLVITEHITVAH